MFSKASAMVLVMSLWYLFLSQSRTNSFGTPIWIIPISSFKIEVFLNQVLKLAFEIPASISVRQFFQSCLVSMCSTLYYLLKYVKPRQLINYVDNLLINTQPNTGKETSFLTCGECS